MKPVKLNKKSIKKATSFAFDGCHKVYLLTDKDDIKTIKEEYGFIICPIEVLEETFKNTCGLRFVSWWNTLDSVIPQFTKNVIFTYNDETKSILNF